MTGSAWSGWEATRTPTRSGGTAPGIGRLRTSTAPAKSWRNQQSQSEVTGYQRTLGRVLTSRRALLAAQALIEGDQTCRADLSRRRIERLLALDTESKALQRQIAHLVGQSDTTLTDICGIGPIVAARILGEVGDVGRFPTEATFCRDERNCADSGFLREN